jgi:RNA polymerase sigma-70 factor (ECF subfamily)
LPTDEDLALGVQQGNKTDLAVLVKRHHSSLLGYLYRMTGGDRALAEDLVQEAFLRVLRSIGQYRHPRPFKPWLYAIATNLARDHYKRAETRYAADAQLDREVTCGPDARPEDRLVADQEAQQVAAAVMALPAHQREALILRYYQGLSLAEVAAALDVPVGTVKSRIHLALRRLRTLLDR